MARTGWSGEVTLAASGDGRESVIEELEELAAGTASPERNGMPEETYGHCIG